ncbi:hypothetical protein [Bremerella cremea]|nr:hypothetical protein [Bremerella cremea]
MFGIRFSLKTLMGLVVVVSVLIVLATKWQYRDRLVTSFLDPQSVEATALLALPVLVEEEGLSTAKFTANYRDVRWLFTRAENRVALSGGLQADFANDQVIIRTDQSDDLKKLVAEMTQADRLEGDYAVVRGVAVDQHNRPVAYLPVDLIGPTPSMNECLTRADGSFSVPVQVKPSDDYSLRFRRSYAETYKTMPFSLGKTKREVVMRVIIPQKG